MTLERRLGESVRQPRLAAAAITALGMVTLILTAVGVYGVLSYTVSQRSRELSVRAALTRLMSAMLFGIGPLDLASFVAAPLLLLPVVVLACLWPAAIAARTDPALMLRQ